MSGTDTVSARYLRSPASTAERARENFLDSFQLGP
jgi:hypothetical protein